VKDDKKVAPDSNWKRLKQILPAPKLLEDRGVNYITTGSDNGAIASKILALDCEMVGNEKHESMLARVCVINELGDVLYDKYVKPTGKVSSYRTRYSGILPHHLSSFRAVPFSEAQSRVAELLKGNIVVGHGLKNDFDALKITHPLSLIRDTSKYPRFQSASGQARKLKLVTLELLSIPIQEGKKGHDPAIDAKAAMDLYLKYKEEWERHIFEKKASHAKL